MTTNNYYYYYYRDDDSVVGTVNVVGRKYFQKKKNKKPEVVENIRETRRAGYSSEGPGNYCESLPKSIVLPTENTRLGFISFESAYNTQ